MNGNFLTDSLFNLFFFFSRKEIEHDLFAETPVPRGSFFDLLTIKMHREDLSVRIIIFHYDLSRVTPFPFVSIIRKTSRR